MMWGIVGTAVLVLVAASVAVVWRIIGNRGQLVLPPPVHRVAPGPVMIATLAELADTISPRTREDQLGVWTLPQRVEDWSPPQLHDGEPLMSDTGVYRLVGFDWAGLDATGTSTLQRDDDTAGSTCG